MNQAIIAELRFFGASVLWGMLILVIYDLLRIVRRVIRHNSFLVAIQDILYWIICSILIFIMMYRQNNGIIRGFSIMAMLIGMIVYHSLLSNALVDGISCVINTVIHYIGKFIKFITSPIRFLLKKILRLFQWLGLKIVKIHKSFLKLLKKIWNSSKMNVSEDEKGD